MREHGSELQLEVSVGNERVRVIMLDGSGLSAWRLRNSRIRAEGLCRTAVTEDWKKVPGVPLALTPKELTYAGVLATRRLNHSGAMT